MTLSLPRVPIATSLFHFAALVRCLTAVRASVAGAALSMILSGMASAHAFTAGLLVVGEDREASLAEAVRGFLLAADERDRHANETSDGHLGGVDVHVLPLPRDAAGSVEGLIGTPGEPPDVLLVLGPQPAVGDAVRVYPSASTVLTQVVLPEGWESQDGTESFVARYRLVYGSAPGVMAATAYHAARRLDVAIRPLDGVVPQTALEDAWRSTEAGLPW